jgi:uncharacterized membrane protein YphA (DoxX/SURF4 family)
VTVAIVILSLLLAAEFVFAPVNLWTGRTIGNYTRFTGLPPRFATRVLAPLKLATALALIAGLAVRALGIAGAAVAVATSCFYLVRFAQPPRRDLTGIAGFALFGAMAAVLLALRLAT